MKLFFILMMYCIKIVFGIFYTKIINTSLLSNNLLNYHHIVLLQKEPFINQTKYNDIYAIDFCPCGNLFEILLGKKIKGKIRLFYIDECNTSNIIQTIRTIKNYRLIQHSKLSDLLSPNLPDLSDIKYIDKNIYDKIINWDLKFHLYTRNCQKFAKYLVEKAII